MLLFSVVQRSGGHGSSTGRKGGGTWQRVAREGHAFSSNYAHTNTHTQRERGSKYLSASRVQPAGYIEQNELSP